MFFLFLIISVILFLHKHVKNPDHHEALRSFVRHNFFTLDYIQTYHDILSLITQLTTDQILVSKLKCKNLNFFSQLLLLLSGNIRLKSGHVYQGTLQCSSKWNIFRKIFLNFIYLSIKICYQTQDNFVLL